MKDSAALLRQLKDLSRDYRDARYQEEKSYAIWNSLHLEFNRTLADLFDRGFLRQFANVEKSKPELWFLGYFVRELIGFDTVLEHENYYTDKDGYEYFEYAQYLSSGLLEQEGISLSNGSGEEITDLATAWPVCGFEVLGRYATACDLIADIVERELEAERDSKELSINDRDKQVDERHEEVGFSSDGRTFFWNGQSYLLRESASRVVQVLYDEYIQGTQYVHEQYIKAMAEIKSDLRTVVRDTKLAELIIRELDAKGKRVNGKWGLAPRKK
jgi:hypothetical protein